MTAQGTEMSLPTSVETADPMHAMNSLGVSDTVLRSRCRTQPLSGIPKPRPLARAIQESASILASHDYSLSTHPICCARTAR